MASGHQLSNGSNHGYNHDGDVQHSPSDLDEVHCPNPLTVFVSAQRVWVERERGWTSHLPDVAFHLVVNRIL